MLGRLVDNRTLSVRDRSNTRQYTAVYIGKQEERRRDEGPPFVTASGNCYADSSTQPRAGDSGNGLVTALARLGQQKLDQDAGGRALLGT